MKNRKKSAEKPIVISLGGSLVVPREGQIDYHFLKKFKELIIKHVKKGKRFIIIVGGGKNARLYQTAAQKISQLVSEDIDWIGIHSTRLNAHLLRTIFREHAHPKINTTPYDCEPFSESILVGAGWRPGFSTDFDAVVLAINYRAQEIINLTDVDYVYDSNPKLNPKAKKIETISWPEFFKVVGKKWTPGAHVPFDPVASRLAAEEEIKVTIANGKNIKNLDAYLSTGKCRGTVIS